MSTPDKKEDPYKEAEITVDAVPAPPQQQDGPPIPAGHSRFYCEKCRTVSFETFDKIEREITMIIAIHVFVCFGTVYI